jgi:hypothetical protein
MNSYRPNGAAARHEIAITRDFRAPISDDDRGMARGWRCIPIPPTDDPRWRILDDGRDYKTTWIILDTDLDGAASRRRERAAARRAPPRPAAASCQLAFDFARCAELAGEGES